MKKLLFVLILCTHFLTAFNIQLSSIPLPLTISYEGVIELEAATLDRIPSPTNTQTNGTLSFTTTIPVTAIGSISYCNFKWCSLYSCKAGSISFDPETTYLPGTMYSVPIAIDMPQGCQRNPEKLVPGRYRLSFYVYSTNTQTAILSIASGAFEVAA